MMLMIMMLMKNEDGCDNKDYNDPSSSDDPMPRDDHEEQPRPRET